MVPTVERGLVPVVFCSIEIVGESPRIESYFGFSIWPEELARVGRERLDVAALALGVERVEGERRFARARDARQHHELLLGDAHVDAAQVVLARAADLDVVEFHGSARVAAPNPAAAYHRGHADLRGIGAGAGRRDLGPGGARWFRRGGRRARAHGGPADRGPRDHGSARTGRAAQRSARGVRSRRAPRRGVRRSPAPDRRRADDQPAVHRRADDGVGRSRAGLDGARGRHWLRLPGRGARRLRRGGLLGGDRAMRSRSARRRIWRGSATRRSTSAAATATPAGPSTHLSTRSSSRPPPRASRPR